jgi:hypothetical protein
MASRFFLPDLIEITLKGGLGNQLFQFAFGINKAINDEIPVRFRDDWFKSQHFRQPIIGELLRVDLNVPLEIKRQGTSLSINPTSKTRFKDIRGTIVQECMHFSAKYAKEKNCIFDGYWQSEKYFYENATLIKSFIREQMDICSQPKQGLIIHVRRGDYLKPENIKVHGLLGREYYEKALKLIDRKYSDRIMVIEDASQLEDSMKDFAKQYSFQINEKQSELEDLNTFSNAESIVIGNSTFSWWGAYLSDADVISPRNWFSSEELRVQNTCDLYPQKWITL